MPLYEIANEILELQNIETDGDVSLEEAIKNGLDELTLSFNDKIDNIVKLEKYLEGNTLIIDVELERLAARKKSNKSKQEYLKKYMLHEMEKLGKKSVDTGLFKVTSAKGRDKVVIDNEVELPSEYVTVKVSESPNKKELLAALKEGEVKGCHLEKSPNNLRIK